MTGAAEAARSGWRSWVARRVNLEWPDLSGHWSVLHVVLRVVRRPAARAQCPVLGWGIAPVLVVGSSCA